MIIGIGTDIVEISRVKQLIDKSGNKFLEKIFSEEEIRGASKYKSEKKYYAYFAKRFAAKEALAKALGAGIGSKISFQNIIVTNGKSGKPEILLKGMGLKSLTKLVPKGLSAKIDLSLSDEKEYALAFVIISSL